MKPLAKYLVREYGDNAEWEIRMLRKRCGFSPVITESEWDEAIKTARSKNGN